MRAVLVLLLGDLLRRLPCGILLPRVGALLEQKLNHAIVAELSGLVERICRTQHCALRILDAALEGVLLQEGRHSLLPLDRQALGLRPHGRLLTLHAQALLLGLLALALSLPEPPCLLLHLAPHLLFSTLPRLLFLLPALPLLSQSLLFLRLAPLLLPLCLGPRESLLLCLELLRRGFLGRSCGEADAHSVGCGIARGAGVLAAETEDGSEHCAGMELARGRAD
mmetsp:Transcript_29425/g.62642  ORF Transcript_29425/g.62642 Transcript_29425/m.62642 type:complete len:224 (+) Transcript_29425:186-857(+)